MRTILLLAACFLALVPAILPAADKAADPADRVTHLIHQLGSRSYREREQAAESLDDLGPAALAALRRARHSDDEEVSRRAEDLLERITQRLEAARLLEPRRVRLVCRDTPVAEAVADLSKQSGVAVQLLTTGITRRDRPATLTLDTGETTFWEALRQLCDRAGLAETRGNLAPNTEITTNIVNGVQMQRIVVRSSGYTGVPDRTVRLVPGQPRPEPACIFGALRFRALGVPVGQAAAGQAGFLLDVTPEPHLGWQGVREVRLEKAVDEHGQQLTQANRPSVPSGVVVPRVAFTETVNAAPAATPVWLNRGERTSRVLREVRGTATVQVLTPDEPLLTVDDVLHATGKTYKGLDGSGMKVVEVRRDEGGAVYLRLHMELAGPGQVAWNANGRIILQVNRNVRAWNSRSAAEAAAAGLYLFDRASRPYRRGEAETTLAANGNAFALELRVKFYPEKDHGDPDRLIHLGKRSVLIDVPFTLKDVPLL
jgi:hypothetical protein